MSLLQCAAQQDRYTHLPADKLTHATSAHQTHTPRRHLPATACACTRDSTTMTKGSGPAIGTQHSDNHQPASHCNRD